MFLCANLVFMEEKRKPRSFNTGSDKRNETGGKREVTGRKGERGKGRIGESENRRVGERGKGRIGESENRRMGERGKGRTGESENRRVGERGKGRIGEWEKGRMEDRKIGRMGERDYRAPKTENYKSKIENRKPKIENYKPKNEYRKSENEYRKPENEYRKRRDVTAESEILSEIVDLRRREGRQSPKKIKILSLEYEEQYGPIRLNKYISNSGICSRRDADMLIQTGAIQVNGEFVTELGIKVMPTDEVRYGDKILQREKPVYLLLNKPKDYITTMDDERDRKHVMQLIKGACKERIYPVGRLDKNTTGLLLFTNDGEMTKKLTHPKHGIRKIYYAELNKNLSAEDFEKITNGITLSDGEIKVDEIAYAGETKREIGITLHSGRNRIVRRIFEQLGYEVVKLDRVVFAGLTKKDLPRGKYRFLTEAEVNILKMTAK